MSGYRISILIKFTLLLSIASGFAQANDSIKPPRRKSIFADAQELTSSDYLAAIERANETMNTVRNESEFKRSTLYIFRQIDKTNASADAIIENLKGANNTNIRNQRMYEKVLFELQQDLSDYQTALQAESQKIKDLKKSLRTVIKDTVFGKLVRDSVLRIQFRPKLFPLKTKFFVTDSLLKANRNVLNIHKTAITEKKMIISEALLLVGGRLDRSGVTMFGNECPNLWDTQVKIRNQGISAFIAEKFSVERSAFSYYFKYSATHILLLILLIGLVFWWIRYNLNYVNAAHKLESLNDFGFRYLNRGVALPVIVIGLNIAIAINLYAPALYIEFLHLLLLASLSILFYQKWQAKAFRRWIWLTAIFSAFCFIDLFFKITLLQRCLFIGLNVIAIRFGLGHLRYIRDEMYVKGFFRWANIVFVSLNAIAILLNLFGRVSLAHTLSVAAVIALTQIIALSVLLKIILEIITLQVYAIRLRRGITTIFDFENLASNAQKPFIFIVIYLWVLVLASNLNLSDTLYNLSKNFLDRKNSIGSFSFSFGGVLLFVIIIWIAHLLQNLVAYLFGEIDDEDEENINKRQHSKLLITRLMLLVAGYLLAISASGMPLDKITIVLGALGVGVGLGLQSIVSNFVSGVILVFERPIQIGDVIESGAQSGRVKEIGLRTTKIDTSNGAEVIIPNGNILSQNIVNWTYNNNYKQIELRFSLPDDAEKDETIKIIKDTLGSVDDVIPNIEPEVFVESILNGKTKLKVKFWCNIYKTEEAISAARVALFERFKDKEIVIEN